MEFTLHYRGSLKAKGDPEHKHELRCHFHRQLRELWNQLPLSTVRDDALNPNPPDLSQKEYGSDNLRRLAEITPFPSLIKPVGAFNFVPLISQKLAMVAELKVTLLRPEPPGAIITQGGDIDNRLKTLFDALKIPNKNALPAGSCPRPDENPFHCLLEDDNLITSISVSTDRLLEQVGDKSEVILVIYVLTKVTASTVNNISLL